MLDRLLDLTDNELWDLIAGRQEPEAFGRTATAATALGVKTPCRDWPCRLTTGVPDGPNPATSQLFQLTHGSY